mmetsp:Transcript_23173/g.53298  ORF Transcript_23173/g.53298 Transcript_23173/m.53298 type:complete len:212 (-) Transcript_23173:228-863(-)
MHAPLHNTRSHLAIALTNQAHRPCAELLSAAATAHVHVLAQRSHVLATSHGLASTATHWTHWTSAWHHVGTLPSHSRHALLLHARHATHLTTHLAAHLMPTTSTNHTWPYLLRKPGLPRLCTKVVLLGHVACLHHSWLHHSWLHTTLLHASWLHARPHAPALHTILAHHASLLHATPFAWLHANSHAARTCSSTTTHHSNIGRHGAPAHLG